MTGKHRRDDVDEPDVAESRAAADGDGDGFSVGSQASDDDTDEGETGARAPSSHGA